MGKTDLQCITECATDFFVTGNGYVRDSLNLKFIPCGRADKIAHGGGLIMDLKFIPYDVADAHKRGGEFLPTPIKICPKVIPLPKMFSSK